MTDYDFNEILKDETTPEALEATVCYLSRLMKPFLQTLEPVLICYPDEGPASLGGIFKEAVLRCEASPVFWGPDYRWKELLKVAFDTHANTLIGHPLLALGLMKLSRATMTPLYIYDVIIGGDPFPRWIVNGLKKGLDCNAWGCYAVNSGPVIAGFSCAQEAGIHIREDVFLPELEVEEGFRTPNRGRLCFRYAKNPELIYDPELIALLQHQPCSCGCDEVRVIETKSVREDWKTADLLQEQLLTWSSILDYKVTYTESGLNLELIVFPGELLPKIPTCAKLTVRYWNPDTDVPIFMQGHSSNLPEKSH